MREESDFFDVRIACFDEKSVMKTIPAHRVVLSACSPVFKELLRAIGSGGDTKGPLIFLRGIAYHEVEAVLEFMYNGQTKVSQTELDAFLAAAEELKIKGLTTSSPHETTTPRKRSFNDSSNGAARLKKKPKQSTDHEAVPSTSTAASDAGDEAPVTPIIVKSESEAVNIETMVDEDDSYYTDMVDDFDNSTFPDEVGHDDGGGGGGSDGFPADTKGKHFSLFVVEFVW